MFHSDVLRRPRAGWFARATTPWRLLAPDSGAGVMVLAALAVAWLTAIPLGVLVWMSIREGYPGDAGPVSLVNFARVFGNAASYQLIANSVVYATGSTTLAVTIGTLLAWAIERTNVRFKGLFYGLALVPLVIPGILFTIAWLFLLTRRTGLINVILANFAIDPLDVHTLGGMVFIEGMSNWSLPFLMMGAAFRTMNPALEEAAVMSGAGAISTFRRVTLRLALPSLLAVSIITFVRSLESVEVPALIGVRGRVLVFTSQIFLVLRGYPPDFGTAAVFSMLLLGISAAGLYLYSRVTRQTEAFATITGKGYRASLIDLGPWRWPVTTAVGSFFVLAVVLPLLIVLWASLLRFYNVPSVEALAGLTTENYQKLFSNPTILRATGNTVVLAVTTATVVMLLTSVLAWIVVRSRLPGRGFLDGLTFIPIAIPGLVIGVSLMWFYLAVPVPVYGTLLILLIAYVTGRLPYGMRLTSASLLQIHRELEEAAQMAGASWWQAFVRVLLPLLRSALLAGWIYIAIVASKEFSASILLYSSESVVLSVLIFDLWNNGGLTEVAAIGVVMSIVMGLAIALYYRLGGRVMG